MNFQSIILIILFAGAAQGLLLSLALAFLRRGNKSANRVLAFLLFLFTLLIFFHASDQLQSPYVPVNEEEQYGHILFFLFGPLFVWYIRLLTNRTFRFTARQFFHLIPFFIAIISYTTIYFFKTEEYLVQIFIKSIPWCMLIQMSVYMIAALWSLRNYAKMIRENYSFLVKINLHWLQMLMIIQTLIWPAAFIVEMTKRSPLDMNILWLLISFFMYLIGYYSIRQPEVFTGEIRENELVHVQSWKKKYEHSTLTQESADNTLQALLLLMKDQKPYLNSDLTLPILAKQLSVSTHHLSQILNERIGQSFFDYINHFRVEEAKHLLNDIHYRNFTLAAIGFEAGFNSISSFNSIFKKYTSQTPSQYRSSFK